MTINVPGPRLTVALTFDHDAISDGIRRGDPPVKISHGEFGPRVGAPRILSLLASRGIPSTWFVPGHTLEAFPESIAAIVEGGHELASHGWYHEDFAELSVDEQRDVLGRSFEALTTARGGTPPTGWRAPYWSLGPRTLELVEAAGFRYDSSLMADDARALPGPRRRPPLRRRGHALGPRGGLVEVPVYWAMDDWPHFEPAPERGRDGLAAPSKVLEIWTAELRYAYEHAPGGLLHGHDAPRVHRPRPPDGDAGAVHRRGRGPRRRRLRAPRRRSSSGSRPAPASPRRARSRRASTASSIGRVSLPVNVFCWLGWYVPMSVYGPTRASAPWPNLGRGRGTALSPATSTTARSAASQPYAPSATSTRTSESSASSRARNGAQLSRSDGSGLFAGGAHRTAAATYAPIEPQPVVGRARRRLVREPDRVHRREQEVARRVAGEHPPGPVAAVRRRRQPDEQDPRVRIAEPRHRPPPVRLVAEARHLLAGDLLPPLDQPRTQAARDDLRRQGLETRPPLGRRRPRYLSSSRSSRRDTTSSPTIPITPRYTTWSRSSHPTTPTAIERSRSTPW